MNIPWNILHNKVLWIYDLWENMAYVTKNRTSESGNGFSHIISPKPLGLAELFQYLK